MGIRIFVLVAFAFLPLGCRNSEDARTSALSGGQRPEGFLVIKDIAPDPAASGSFLVTCASAAGEKKTSVSQTDLEANRVCLAEVASGGASQSPTPSGETSSPPSVSGYEAKNNQSTYLKSRPNLDVTATGESNLKVGVDFCVISAPIAASVICTHSEKELKVTGIENKIAGCDLTSGYIFKQHFAVTPSVSACK